ncbi:MAG: hypothetical protein JOZ75_11160 [Candidatus Dormibacteraeota bacterium]|nr:hypothetical protein [Candidatus Dormibacteraeota bacterium]
MERIGIRELARRARDVVRRVTAGEELEIPATRSLRDIEPAAPLPGKSLSEVLEEMRTEEQW